MVFRLPPAAFYCHRVNPKPCLWIAVPVVCLDALWAEAAWPFGLAELRRESSDVVDADQVALALAWGRRLGWRTSVTSVVAGRAVVVDAEMLSLVVAPVILVFFPLTMPPIDDVAGVAVIVDGAASVHGLSSTSLCPIPATRLFP